MISLIFKALLVKAGIAANSQYLIVNLLAAKALPLYEVRDF
jgi:hypothetical protein